VLLLFWLRNRETIPPAKPTNSLRAFLPPCDGTATSHLSVHKKLEQLGIDGKWVNVCSKVKAVEVKVAPGSFPSSEVSVNTWWVLVMLAGTAATPDHAIGFGSAFTIGPVGPFTL
jgi:hypothetical protein